MREPMNSKEELFARLNEFARYVRKIHVTWNVSDGGPRMDVTLFDEIDRVVHTWNDWMILGESNYPGTRAIQDIVKTVFGESSIREALQTHSSLILHLRG